MEQWRDTRPDLWLRDTQMEGIDFLENFSPVAKTVTVKSPYCFSSC